MKRTLFGLITVLLALGLVLSGCAGPADPFGDLARAAKDKAGNGITWNDGDADVAVVIDPVTSARKNASGPKIPSNAHSNDFPGVFFHWDSKQKDGGYLKVAPGILDNTDNPYADVEIGAFKGFVLTKKVSNMYWDYPISLQPNQKPAADGWFVFEVPKGRYYENDKGSYTINMVFLPEFRPANPDPIKIIGPSDEITKGVIAFQKIVVDADGKAAAIADSDLLSFAIYDGDTEIVSGLKLDADGWVRYASEKIIAGVEYEIRETIGSDLYEDAVKQFAAPNKEVKTVTIVSGPEKDANGLVSAEAVGKNWDGTGSWNGSVVNYWTDQITGLYGNIMGSLFSVKTSVGEKAEWVWSRWDSWMTGYDGSEVILYTKFFDLTGFELPAEAKLYYACDNAAVVYVNGVYAGHTFNSIVDDPSGKALGEYRFATLDYQTIRHQEEFWKHAYEIDIADLLNGGLNEIVFYAANSSNMQEGGVSIYTTENNPAGILFACQFDAVKEGSSETQTFKNVLKPVKKLGSSYSSVTGTNGPFVVSGTNHFTYAKLDRAALEAGVVLDMVEGNKINKVGEATVTLVGGKLVISMDGKGTFGAVASATPFNGNVHSGKNFSHDNKSVIDCPDSDVIYLYIHCDSFAFYQYK